MVVIPHLGKLNKDPDFEDWLVSKKVPVPYLAGTQVNFIIEGLEGDAFPKDFLQAISNFLTLTEKDGYKITPYIFQIYRRAVKTVGERGLGFVLTREEDVWSHLRMTSVRVVRRPHADTDVYIQVEGACDWDMEHGVQIVLRKGNMLVRVSSRDGHLTTADAYGLPDDEDQIVYNG